MKRSLLLVITLLLTAVGILGILSESPGSGDSADTRNEQVRAEWLASHSFGKGERITERDLISSVPDGKEPDFTLPANSLARYPIAVNEPVNEKNTIAPGQPGYPSLLTGEKIPYAVMLDRPEQLAQPLKPGDSIDITVIYALEKQSSEQNKMVRGWRAQRILSGREVLEVSAVENKKRFVTLALDPADISRLIISRQSGWLELSLSLPGKTTNAEAEPLQFSEVVPRVHQVNELRGGKTPR